jgi:hypothetical protein
MSGEGIQLRFQSEPFVPVTLGEHHYVAAVQNKPGELAALQNANRETWDRLTPVIEIVGPRTRPPVYRRERVANWMKRVAVAIGSHPCFLDTLRIRPGHPTTHSNGTRAALDVIYEEAKKRRIEFVPVLPVGDADAHERFGFVRGAAARDGRGVALRYRILRFALEPGTTHASVLITALKKLELEVTSADILIDLGFMSGDEELHADDLSAALLEVAAVGKWRSTVLLGTSMPSMLGGTVPEGTVGQLPRREWDLWQSLQAGNHSPMPTYGDYVVQHPDPPADDAGGGPSMRANIRYTLAEHTLVARGRGSVIVEGREQYRELCQQLVDSGRFSGAGFSWGDAQIAGCAQGLIEPGAQNHWRGAGTSHHFRLVTQQVR